MLTLIHYLPYLAVFALIAFFLVLFSGDERKTDYRRAPRQQHYQWNDNTAHRDR
jgi:hypothetical protein